MGATSWVDANHPLAAPAPCSARLSKQHRDVDQLGMEQGRSLARPIVLAEEDAVIAHEQDRRRVVQSEAPEAVEKAAEPVVRHGHACLIGRLKAADVAVAEVARRACVADVRDLIAAVVGVAVHVEVAPRRRPWLVRLEAVDDHQEAALTLRRGEEPRRRTKDARARLLELVAPAPVVRKVLPDRVDARLRAQRTRREAPQRLGARHERARTRSPRWPSTRTKRSGLRRNGSRTPVYPRNGLSVT